MLTRVTTNGTLRTYKSDLMRNTNTLNKTREKVLTQRNFNSYAEDPAGATLSFKLRRQFSAVNDQLSNTSTLVNRFQTAWTAVGSVKGAVETAAKDATLRALNDPTGSGRQPLAETLSSTAKSIVQTLNAQYGSSFIFAGNDGLTTPFSWSDTGGLLYRGISVDAGLPSAPPPDGVAPPSKDVVTGSDWDLYYQAYPDYAKLVDMSYETVYIDVGAGLSEHSDGEINAATAFNSALCGLDFLGGFGYDKDGDPKNAVSLMKEISNILRRTDKDTGNYATKADEANAPRLAKKLENALASITNAWTDLDGKASYLETNKDRLTDDAYSLNERILGLEQVELADAITDYSWAQYCYNAALKVGTDIIGQSLIDFMR